MKRTPRDLARHHWYDLADPDCTPSAETMEWLREMALLMISADALPAADRREAVFDASGLKGPAYDGTLGVLMVALREYERLRRSAPKSLKGMNAVEFVVDRLEWDTDHEVAPDSHRRRIRREIKDLADEDARAWVLRVLDGK